MRRNESRERREPERLRLWPLLALPDRVRLDSSSTAASSALFLSPLSIGVEGNGEPNRQLFEIQSPSIGEFRPE